MRAGRGFSLVETLFGLLILSFIVLTSLLIVFERERRLRFAAETIAAYQALANEVEIRRHIPYEQLLAGEYDQFESDTAIVADFQDLEQRVSIKETGIGVKEVTLLLRWSAGQRSVSLTVFRTWTGGDNLW